MTDSNPAVAVVVVQWFIKPGREEDYLRANRKNLKRADGFLGEVLFRAVVDTDDPADDNPVVFFTMGYWRSREDFYRRLRHLKPGGEAAMNDYEASPRQRHWLVPAG